MRGEQYGPGDVGENSGEAEVREWDEQDDNVQEQRKRRQSWFERITGRRKGQIRLQEDDENHPESGEGDGD